MKTIKLGFPDGNGVIGGTDFWSEYCNIINITNIDVTHNLVELQKITNSIFPSNICLASKYRIGRAVLMAPLVDFLIFFLHNDRFVYNCPNSVYRIKWVKAYLSLNYPKVKVIVWPFDLNEHSDFQNNIVELTELIGGDVRNIKQFVTNYDKIPSRTPVYSFNKSNNGKKNIMLIGKVPFMLDPYRKTSLMDILFQSYNIFLPHLINNNIVSSADSKDSNVVFYKENSIIKAIDVGISEYNIIGFVFAADVFDIPGNYTFPIIKKHLEKNNQPFIHIKVSLNNYDSVLDTIVDRIEKMVLANDRGHL